MSFLNSDELLNLLQRQLLLTGQQRQKITLEKGKQRQKLLKRADDNGMEADKSYPDLVDIVASFQLEIHGRSEVVLDEEVIMQAVAQEFQLPFKKLDPLALDMDVVTKSIPRNFAVTHLLLPFNMQKGILEIAVYHPDKKTVLADIEQANQVTVRPYIATKSDIRKIQAEFFGFQKSIRAAESQFAGPGLGSSVDIGNLEQFVKISSAREISSSDQHIKSAVNHLFHYALDQQASDIHIEPKRDACMVRFRIDGMLHPIYKLPKVVHAAITARIKSLARMDISEKRRPQDGRIKIGVGGKKEVEIRVSTVPVSFGEKTVMRILDSDVIFQDLDHLAFSHRDRQVFDSFINAPHGIVLVTGPTGSGKSTTLYSTLKKIATPEKNIVTVEDPVEMVHEEFNQISVQPLIDVTFSTILRNILRQDPDIIMIGEIRDLETAAHAVQAAMTGHLVLSTLHTNDAVSSIVRLMDMGLEAFLISSTLLGCVAQRLVRTICPGCVETFQMEQEELLKLDFPVSGSGTIELKRGKGCRQCRGTGYKGRCGVFEVFVFSEQISRMLRAGEDVNAMRKLAIREGMTTLREDAWQKVKTGITTYQEAIRVTS
ncbi:MAG: GspE/PulE family protein [Proteobacteria bacterium]|jgi:general secretion pathway protein E|nr:type II/IV secretion system protein [Desulfocapsa sp.]MBU3943259.1 GspE/PulE family protein [Pseudomonadota bacterium]MCG2744373.1 GspE/PulE family protein [Desulfobacteraceae bacterium]MBU4027768.1 GspE/PulE family protein [Pseudomonadota bacterium]MBU4042809.1 GspE/PulE family protein [Pseudomonadota bacterium]